MNIKLKTFFFKDNAGNFVSCLILSTCRNKAHILLKHVMMSMVKATEGKTDEAYRFMREAANEIEGEGWYENYEGVVLDMMQELNEMNQ